MTRRRGLEPDEQALSIPEANPESVARQILLRRLAQSPRTEHQLREDLHRREVPPDVADRVIKRFIEVGLIDDATYAALFVDSRRRLRGTSRRGLRAELRKRGVDESLIDGALEDIDDEDEQVLANSLAEKRWGRLRDLPREVRYRRLMSFLGRKGFSAAVAGAAVRHTESLPTGESQSPTTSFGYHTD